jgi:hypothetical protein
MSYPNLTKGDHVPRKKNEDLATFQDWLTQEQCLADSTAVVYASNLRRVLESLSTTLDHKVDVTSADDVTALFAAMAPKCSRKAFTGRLSAWRKFKHYAKWKEGMEVALPKTQSFRRGPTALPVEVRAAVHYLISDCKFKQRDLLYLKWKHVEPLLPQLSVARLRDPMNPGEVADVPKEYIKALIDYSGRIDDDQPLLPMKPQSMSPYPKAGIRRELKLYRDSIGDMPQMLSPSEMLLPSAPLVHRNEIATLRDRWAAEHVDDCADATGEKVSAPAEEETPSMSTNELLSFLEEGKEK